MSHLPKHSILILILMLIRIQEFLTGYLPLRIAKSLVIIKLFLFTFTDNFFGLKPTRLQIKQSS